MSDKKKTTKQAEEEKRKTPQERMNDLIERGKKDHKLSSAAVMELEEEISAEQMERFYEALAGAGIELVADEDLTLLPTEDDGLPEIEEIPEEETVDPTALSDSFGIDDPVRMYLKEIGKVALLTSDEEVLLAKQMFACDSLVKYENYLTQDGIALDEEAVAELRAFLEQVANDEVPIPQEIQDALAQVAENGVSAAQDRELVKAMRRTIRVGEDAKKRLADANLRLVVSIAKRYVGRGMQFLDLIQEGNLGLLKAVEKFDYSKGYKFSTYATWWIRQAITRAIADQARTIRIPVHMVETINKVIRVSRQLLQELGHEATPEEIGEEMNMPADKVREILKIAQDPVSLETPIGEEEDSHLGDFIEDEGASEPSEAAASILLKEQLEKVLQTLTPRESRVLELRYGIKDGRTRTLEEVGKEFNVTRERIRQIEAKALRKLRHPSRSKMLRDFMN